LDGRTAWRWIPAIAWTVVIFIVSSVPAAVPEAFQLKFADKVAHVVEFAVLGVLLSIGWNGTIRGERRPGATLFVLSAGAAIGFLDELYQLTVPGRMLEFLDWVSDVAGTAIGNGLAVACGRWALKRAGSGERGSLEG
jgi:VanZ family protein